jgi:hypothetical protein
VVVEKVDDRRSEISVMEISTRSLCNEGTIKSEAQRIQLSIRVTAIRLESAIPYVKHGIDVLWLTCER